MDQFQESIICAIASLLLGDQVVVSEAIKGGGHVPLRQADF